METNSSLKGLLKTPKNGTTVDRQVATVVNLVNNAVENDVEDTTKLRETEQTIETDKPIETDQVVESVDKPIISEETTVSTKQSDSVSKKKKSNVGYHTAQYKYEYKQQVYIPEYREAEPSDIYGVMQPEFKYLPLQVVISEISISNKICYRFFKKPKLIVSEDFICTTYEECVLKCEELNDRR